MARAIVSRLYLPLACGSTNTWLAGPLSVCQCVQCCHRESVCVSSCQCVQVSVCMSTCFKVYVIAQLCPLYAHVRVCPGETRVFVPVCSSVNAHVSVHSYVFQKSTCSRNCVHLRACQCVSRGLRPARACCTCATESKCCSHPTQSSITFSVPTIYRDPDK